MATISGVNLFAFDFSMEVQVNVSESFLLLNMGVTENIDINAF